MELISEIYRECKTSVRYDEDVGFKKKDRLDVLLPTRNNLKGPKAYVADAITVWSAQIIPPSSRR
jgi:hypothetical protein